MVSVGIFSCGDISFSGDEDNNGAKKEVTYSYKCIDSAVAGKPTNRTLGKAGDILRNITVDDDKITDQVQTEYGEAFHKDAIESKTFKLISDGALQAKLDKAMNELLAQRKSPSAIKYYIYALDDTAINAFTFGGRIYVTQAMLNRTKDNEALLYAIIGHEIGHSEKGHIKKTIQEIEIANKIFGEDGGGTFAFQIKKLLTGSFNQKNELEADYYGTDLTYSLNQDVCAAVVFWKDMAKNENAYNKLEDFFRSHPFSSLRAQCLQDHITENFGKNCTAETKKTL